MRNGYDYDYGYGFGQTGTLTQGTDFNCNSSICYGIGGANDALFKQLQQALNQFSALAGFQQLTVDGWIGDQTVGAVQTVASNLGLSIAPQSKEDVAANAPALIAALSVLSVATVASGQSLSPPGSPVQPVNTPAAAAAAATPSVIVSPGAPASSAAAALPTGKISGVMLAVFGGLAAVLLVGGIGFVFYRRRARHKPERKPERRRR